MSPLLPEPEPEAQLGPEAQPEPSPMEEPERGGFDASKTIELRPADLRRAGILPPEDRPGLTRVDDTDD